MEVGGKSCSGYPYVCITLYPLWETRSVFGGEGKPTPPIFSTFSGFKIPENLGLYCPLSCFFRTFPCFWAFKVDEGNFPLILPILQKNFRIESEKVMIYIKFYEPFFYC